MKEDENVKTDKKEMLSIDFSPMKVIQNIMCWD